jgi:hypothetical protein
MDLDIMPHIKRVLDLRETSPSLTNVDVLQKSLQQVATVCGTDADSNPLLVEPLKNKSTFFSRKRILPYNHITIKVPITIFFF